MAGSAVRMQAAVRCFWGVSRERLVEVLSAGCRTMKPL